MQFKKFLMTLTVGLAACGVSSATTLTNSRSVVDELDLISTAKAALKIGPDIQRARFLPEVQVGNGSRPGLILSEDDTDSSNDAPEGSLKEQSDS
jgi:hypothetical protein